MARGQSPGTFTCTHQTGIHRGRRGERWRGWRLLLISLCLLPKWDASSLCRRLNGSHEPAIWTQQMWVVAIFPPTPSWPGQRDLENLALSHFPTLPGMASANQSSSYPPLNGESQPRNWPSQWSWKGPGSQPCHWVGPWDRDLRPQRRKWHQLPNHSKGWSSGEAKPWLSHSLLTAACLAVAVTVLVFLSELT